MRRIFWLAMGVTIGALLVRKISRAAEKLTPRGLAGGLGSGLSELAEAIREFAADVRAAMSERETELRQATGLDGRAEPAPNE
jgi:chromosome condensin MukBEF MukE localization factor